MVKSRYRNKILALRRAQLECDPENKVEKDEIIRDHVLDLLEWQDAAGRVGDLPDREQRHAKAV